MPQNSVLEQSRASKEEMEAYHERVTKYLTSMSMVKQMYREGIIDKDDYAISENLMASKYGISEIDTTRHTDPDDPKSFPTRKKMRL